MSVSTVPILLPAKPPRPLDLGRLGRARPLGFIHRTVLALVWLAVASSFFVFSEPAPVDVLNMGLVVLLPAVGLFVVKRELVAMFALWLVVAAGGFIASGLGHDMATATIQTSVSLYLYVAAFVLAGFVAANPRRHVPLILDAYLVSALIAATLAFSGYFDLPSGAAALFTRYSRATGAFKDPNVLGAFLAPAIVYAFHLVRTRSAALALPLLAVMGYLGVALLLTFSRGAWFAAAAGVAIYAYLSFVTARRDLDRLRILAIGLIGGGALALALLATSELDQVSDLLSQRASLTQSYDEGPEGRFGGQMKALRVLSENPLGIGALEFNVFFHHEDPHNSYLTMFLNAGWIGGFAFLVIVGLTLVLGFRHALKRTHGQAMFIVVYASLAAMLFESAIIDSDHWRHLHLLFALAWGMMAADKAVIRNPRIIADRRNVLLQSLIVLPPSRRDARILSVLAPRRTLPHDDMWHRPARIISFPSRDGRRAPRIGKPRVLN